MKVHIPRLVGMFVGEFVILALLLFVPAGTWSWTAGWVFIGVFFCYGLIFTIWLVQTSPDMLNERMRGLTQADQPLWDKLLLALVCLVFVGWFILMGLDAVRWHWSHIPVWLQGVGLLLLLSSFWLFFLVFRENTYLSAVVRVQRERGHAVISSGPYRYVRHPMYAAMLPFSVGISLLLGSWYGLLASLLLMVLMGRRAVLEERTLLQELPGYDAYLSKVRYRFVPYLW